MFLFKKIVKVVLLLSIFYVIFIFPESKYMFYFLFFLYTYVVWHFIQILLLLVTGANILDLLESIQQDQIEKAEYEDTYKLISTQHKQTLFLSYLVCVIFIVCSILLNLKMIFIFGIILFILTVLCHIIRNASLAILKKLAVKL